MIHGPDIQRLVNLTSLRNIYVEFRHSVVGLLTKPQRSFNVILTTSKSNSKLTLIYS